MADVEDLRSASEEEEESEDEYNYESEASTDPVADASDQLDVDVARCCARYGDAAAERSTTTGSRALIVTLSIDPTRSQASSETRQASISVWKSTPLRHRADPVTGTTSRR